MKYIILLVVSFNHFNLSSQTCIIVKHDKDSLFIASDTKILNTSLNYFTRKLDTSYTYTKKIYYNGKFGFGISGFKPEDNYEIAKKICDSENSLDNIIKTYFETFKIQWFNYIMSMSRDNPETFSKLLNTGIGGIVFWGNNNDTLKVIYLEMSIKETQNAYILQGDTLNITNSAFIFGTVGKLRSLDLINSKNTWINGRIKGIASLMKKAKEFEPNHVGGDMNIITLQLKNISNFKEFTIKEIDY